MASSVMRELEELRSLLDQPKKTFSPLKTLERISTPRSPAEAVRTYNYALNSAEKSVDRLGRAIEAAEEEMESALRRTADMHRNQVKQKEIELQELQRVIAAKERSIDSLRDTLATTKRTYESRLAQAESAAALKDAEIKALQEELRVARLERDTMAAHLARADQHSASLEAAVGEREAELSSTVRAKSDEATKALMALRYEKKDKDELRSALDDMRRQLRVAEEQLRHTRDEAALTKDRYEVELEEMRRRVKTEKNLRKACEKWLRSELKSREEMELLLSAVKDAASSKNPPPDILQVEALIENLGAYNNLRERSVSPSAPPPLAAQSSQRSIELDAMRGQLEDDNRRLRTELLAARKMLADRLKLPK